MKCAECNRKAKVRCTDAWGKSYLRCDKHKDQSPDGYPFSYRPVLH